MLLAGPCLSNHHRYYSNSNLPAFLTASKNFDLPLTKVPLLLKDNRFTIDFKALENLSTKPGDLFMLCHPYNPVGTLFRENELRDLIEWLVQRELYLCSDEIHCDLVLEKELKHLPLHLWMRGFQAKVLRSWHQAKHSTLPDLVALFAVISEPALRARFKKAIRGIVPDPPAMGFCLLRLPIEVESIGV